MLTSPKTRSLAAALSLAAAGALVVPQVSLAVSPAQAPAPHDVTSPVEAKRVDSVQAKVEWKPCGITGNNECAVINVPMDYDNPTGPTMLVQAERNKTSKPGKKKGDIWVVDRSLMGTRGDIEYPETFLSADVLDNFDVVGVQPRGTFKVEHTGVQCFNDGKEQLTAMRRLQLTTPVNPADQDGYLRMGKLGAERCSTKGMPIASHLSIAQQVRDIEVMRRLLSKDKMTMVSRAEGSQIAQTYAAMFPDRVRAIYVNGAVDPVQYNGGVGQHALRSVRTNQDIAAQRAMDRMFTWCDTKGVEQCAFAKNAPQGTAAKFKGWYDELLKKPVITNDPELPFDSGALVEMMLAYSYTNSAPRDAGEALQAFWDDTHAQPAQTAAAKTRLGSFLRQQRDVKIRRSLQQDTPKPNPTTPAPAPTGTPAPSDPRPPFPGDDDKPAVSEYANFTDNWMIGMCSEGQHVSEGKYFKDQIAEVKRRAPLFGEPSSWPLSICAQDQWKAIDQQQYTGNFSTRPATPLLMGVSRFSSIHDVASAQSAARRAPGSVLVTNEGWGADAYMASRCLAKVVDSYLIDLKLPAGNQSCEPEWKDELPVQR